MLPHICVYIHGPIGHIKNFFSPPIFQNQYFYISGARNSGPKRRGLFFRKNKWNKKIICITLNPFIIQNVLILLDLYGNQPNIELQINW